MGGMVSKLKKEDVGALGRDGSHMHPLLIPQVARTIFSSLGKKDLLSARRVCREWHVLGTETYKNRKDIVHLVFSSNAEVSFQQFMDVMTLTPRIPVIRWDLYINLLSLPPADLLQFLSFIAPSIRRLEIGFHPPYPPSRERRMNALGELLYKLNTLDPVNLMMPELEVLDVRRWGWGGVPGYAEGVVRVTARIVAGAHALKAFICNFALEQSILQSLPKGLQRLDFLDPLEAAVGGNPYAVLMTSGSQITELRDRRFDPDGLFEFLSLQKLSLCWLSVRKLEEVFGRRWSFPQLKFVTKLECDVSCNSTFEFLKAFPNLVELTVFVAALIPPAVSKMVEIAGDVSSLSQYRRVRTLHISFPTWEDQSQFDLDQLIVFGVFGHCFPNLTHLSIPMKGSARWMRDVFAQFQNLESLYLNVFYEETPPREWETLLSGIPAALCEAMKEAGNYDVDDESRFETGLTNLKRLQTLEVRDENNRFEFMFSDLIYHRVFSRMVSLKKICFVEESRIPEACLPFDELLNARGIDLYRTKREIDIDLDYLA